jgi:hypothetical protein
MVWHWSRLERDQGMKLGKRVARQLQPRASARHPSRGCMPKAGLMKGERQASAFVARHEGTSMATATVRMRWRSICRSISASSSS